MYSDRDGGELREIGFCGSVSNRARISSRRSIWLSRATPFWANSLLTVMAIEARRLGGQIPDVEAAGINFPLSLE